MRALLHASAVAAIAVPAVAVGATPATPAAAGDTVLQAQTAATAVHLALTQQPASSIVTASLVDDAAAYAAAAFDSGGGSDAQAAPLYPGKLVVQGPALFCSELFPCPASPPDYPLLADASYPRRPHAASTADKGPVGSGPLVVTPGATSATASDAGNESATASAGVSLLSGTPAAVTTGATRAVSRVVTRGGHLVVHVETSVSDVDIAGLLHIDAIRSTDDVTVRAGAKPVDRPHVMVTGVTVAGVAATIDDEGVHVAGQGAPGVGQRLAQRGVTVRTVGADREDRAGLARSTATALEVTFATPVSGAPYVPNPLSSQPPFDNVPGLNANGTYVGRITFAAVGTVAGANAQPTFDLGGLLPLGGPGTPPAAAAQAASTSTGGTVPGSAAVAGAPAAQAPVVSRAPRLLRGLLDGFTDDLGTLYAVLALGTAFLFVGWRGSVALRHRRGPAGRSG